MKSIPIIYYHSIALKQNPKWPKRHLTLELKFFEDQMRYLAKKKYRTMFLDEYFDRLSSSLSIKERNICITFDDGLLDNFIYAFPILKKYNLKATIFVSPEFVDKNSPVRKTLLDYWKGNASFDEIDRWGYLTWDEMKEMEKSGLIDIQSHTMSHTKYFVNDNLIKFHHPGADCIYQIGNKFPDEKPYYIENENFEKLIPYGTPFFEQASAVIARIRYINEDFNQAVVKRLSNEDPADFKDFEATYNHVKDIIDQYRNRIIVKVESESEYMKRLYYELGESRKVIGSKLNKSVEYCCWPHGDYNEKAQEVAQEVGYKGTTIVLKRGQNRPADRFNRTGLYHVRNDRFLSMLKAKYKIGTFEGRFPWAPVAAIYGGIKNY